MENERLEKELCIVRNNINECQMMIKKQHALKQSVENQNCELIKQLAYVNTENTKSSLELKNICEKLKKKEKEWLHSEFQLRVANKDLKTLNEKFEKQSAELKEKELKQMSIQKKNALYFGFYTFSIILAYCLHLISCAKCK
jgi:hypothetical protein